MVSFEEWFPGDRHLHASTDLKTSDRGYCPVGRARDCEERKKTTVMIETEKRMLFDDGGERGWDCLFFKSLSLKI